jgi:hypothetical protein
MLWCTDLIGGVSVSDSYGIILQSIEIDSDTERRADLHTYASVCMRVYVYTRIYMHKIHMRVRVRCIICAYTYTHIQVERRLALLQVYFQACSILCLCDVMCDQLSTTGVEEDVT